MKKYVFVWLLLLLPLVVAAQKLTVERMEAAPMDLSASTQQRNDRVGNACALVKVQLAAAGAQFEGNVIGDVAFRTGEYWVYMSEGSYMLNVKHPNFLPLFVNFRDQGIKRVESKVTYVLTIGMPQTGAALVQMQKLTINYTPTTAMVIVDSKPYQGNGKVEIDLPVGSHDYMIVATGYVTAEGSVKLNAEMPRTITEHLVVTDGVAQQPIVQQQQVVQQQPQVQQQVADEFAGLTAQQIADIAEDYYYGRNGKSKDYALTVKWAKKAAEMGDRKGQFQLGMCYKKGEGVIQDYAEAVKWYRKAAEQEYANAQYNLGVCYYSGQGVSQDYAKAVKWYRKAAEQGFADGQNDLGVCYEWGRGVTKDYAEAVKWYRKAAEQGIANAQYNLGVCYYYGRGVTQDHAEAVKWYRKAAEQGYPNAQYDLGDSYYNGQGVTQDRDKARELWRKAAAQGNQGAKDNLKNHFGE